MLQIVTTPSEPDGDMACLLLRQDLSGYLDWIWQKYFYDIPRMNEIHIEYCYPWKNRLGLIRMSVDRLTSFIGINSLLQLPQVPDCVLLTTIAHELVHYTHGFGSPLPRLCKYPHAHGVVDKELTQRELGSQLACCNEWLDQYWYPFYDQHRQSGWVSLHESSRPSRSIQQSPV